MRRRISGGENSRNVQQVRNARHRDAVPIRLPLKHEYRKISARAY